ncbi:hypothetical protein OIU84_002349 [Salix udensis]|uniref:non-specific serine/threonine protein kinase n=1 Tax=Salix udensis TaxID=889485 RepID=A0AAD6P511_9ROSI|nr:hypothetical protein OIU84_002349 [Salix udensis]
MITMRRIPVTVFLFSLLSLAPFCHAATDRLTKGQSIKDGETLKSSDENFELGFFSLGNSTSRYVGIRYSNIQDKAVIWVANREKPISGTDGVLRIGEDGNLQVVDGNGNLVWSSSAEIHLLSSWKSASDPSPGNFTMGVDPRGAPQIVIWEQSRRRWRSGYWNGIIFSGVPFMAAFTTYQYGLRVSSENGGKLYLTYTPSDPSELNKFQITWNGFEEQKRWNKSTEAWQVIQSQPSEDCENYNYCGNFGVCTPSGSPRCSCLEGFQPRHPDQWRLGNWSGGCERRSPLQCQRNTGNGGEDGFKAVRCTKLPDFADKYRVTSDDCKKRCVNNCSCTAYAYVDAIGCMLWNGDLTDVQNHIQSGNTMHVRLAYSELGDEVKAYVKLDYILSSNLFPQYRSQQQDGYTCDSTDSFGWTGLPSHLCMATVVAQKETQR